MNPIAMQNEVRKENRKRKEEQEVLEDICQDLEWAHANRTSEGLWFHAPILIGLVRDKIKQLEE